MRKIPSLYLRDPEDTNRLLREPNPTCRWVFEGEGRATRKLDGTCMLFDPSGRWWSRRMVKPGKQAPPNYLPVETDPVTGKTFGWEPAEQSSAWVKPWRQALALPAILDEWPHEEPVPGATYELIGPTINGNPSQVDAAMLVRHGYTAAVERPVLENVPTGYDELADWLSRVHELIIDGGPPWEGIVWHHPDGRMAKIKAKDFPA